MNMREYRSDGEDHETVALESIADGDRHRRIRVAQWLRGGGAPDPTPFGQTALDRAADAAKKEAETRADAVAKAMAAAGRAATEAKKAKDAADAAAVAAKAAATAATTAGLSVGEAMARKAEADKQSGLAAAAYEAAKMAANDAAAQTARHMDAKQYSDAATASSNAAKRSTEMAKASAAAAMRFYGTAQRLSADRDATAGLAAAAGVHVQTAKSQADTASDEADKAKAQVKKAKDAQTFEAADAARKAASTARDEARTAAGAADAAAKAAEGIGSEAPAVTMQKAEARKHATAAMASFGKAEMYLDHTAGYADARKARDQADAGKMDLASHGKFKGIVDWIEDATTTGTKLENAAKAARTAAERLESTEIAEVIESRQGNLATALSAAMGERTKAGDDLKAAMDVYNAARPFSENGMGIDDDNLASGETLRHRSDMLALDNSDVRVFAAWQELPSRGAYDVVRDGIGVVSLGDTFRNPPSTDTRATHAMYQVYHNNYWKTAGNETPYQYVSYGLWARARNRSADTYVGGFSVPTAAAPNTVVGINADKNVAEANTFVFAKHSDLSSNLPITGTAAYVGSHLSHMTSDSGRKGAGGNTAVARRLGTSNAVTGYFVEGRAMVAIDFAGNSATLELDNSANNDMFYDVTGIKLTGNRLSGGAYRGQDFASGATGRRDLDPAGPSGFNVPNDPLSSAGASYGEAVLRAAVEATTLKLHGGVFGDRAQEVAGTVNVEWRLAHRESGTNLANARDASISIHTAFGARNSDFR